MKKKWRTVREYEPTHTEEVFERRMAEEGFTFKGIREYLSRTDYQYEKDGTVIEWSYYLPNYDSRKVDMEKMEMNVAQATDMWSMKKKLEEHRAKEA